jgi:hypothetical protein
VEVAAENGQLATMVVAQIWSVYQKYFCSTEWDEKQADYIMLLLCRRAH